MMKIDEFDMVFCAGILTEMKKEVDKRNVLYEHGVDLINYDNIYTSCLMDCLYYILGENVKDDIEWWLYESVDKEIWINDKSYDVTKPYDLLQTVLQAGK